MKDYIPIDRYYQHLGARVLRTAVLALGVSILLSCSALAQENAAAHSFTPIQLEIEKQKQRLNSSDVEERRDALMRLGRMHRAEASRPALAALSDPLPIIRATAATALSGLPGDEGALALVPLLSDKDEFVRQQASYALGALRSPAGFAAFVDRLQTENLNPHLPAPPFAPV